MIFSFYQDTTNMNKFAIDLYNVVSVQSRIRIWNSTPKLFILYQ